MFDKNFKNFVSFAVQKSKEYYSNELNLNTANPYFIGFGNPNSEILIMGKEKGFCEKNSEQLQYESIENPNEWKYYIDNQVELNKLKYGNSEYYINAFRPYFSKMKGGHTWNKYHTLLKNIYPQIKKDENEFLNYTFISEINFLPSRLSKIKKFNNIERINFLMNEYFRSFNVIICACGDYLTDSQIEEIFDVKFELNISNPNEKLKIFRNDKRVLVNTRQLSMNIKMDYLIRISEVAKEYLTSK